MYVGLGYDATQDENVNNVKAAYAKAIDAVYTVRNMFMGLPKENEMIAKGITRETRVRVMNDEMNSLMNGLARVVEVTK